MAMLTLGLDELNALDQGIITAAFNSELAMLKGDIADRGDRAKGKTWKLTLQLDITPTHIDDRGNVEQCDVVAALQARKPALTSRVYSMEFRTGRGAREGELLFRAESPDDPRQMTLGEAAEDHDEDEGGVRPVHRIG